MIQSSSAAGPIDALAAIVDEELTICQRLEALADAQTAALREGALEDLAAIIAEQLALAEALAAREQARRGLVAPGSTLAELIEMWGAPAASLKDRREALIAQVGRLRRANERNQALLAKLLRHQQDRLRLALEERALYDGDGNARPTPVHGLVDRRV